MRFHFDRGHYQNEFSRYPYNQFSRDSPNPHNGAGTNGPARPVEDLRLAATVELAEPATPVKLQTTARLDQPDWMRHPMQEFLASSPAMRREELHAWNQSRDDVQFALFYVGSPSFYLEVLVWLTAVVVLARSRLGVGAVRRNSR